MTISFEIFSFMMFCDCVLSRYQHEGKEGESSTEPQWGGSVDEGGDGKKTTHSASTG